MRYMKSNAREDLKKINVTLAILGHDRHLRLQGRNGYQGLDLFDADGCLRTIATGTPRKCIDAANDYLRGVAVDKAETAPKNSQGLTHRMPGSFA